MSEPTIPLDARLSLEDCARLIALSEEACKCTRGQRAGSVYGSEVACDSCMARKWQAEGTELIDSL